MTGLLPTKEQILERGSKQKEYATTMMRRIKVQDESLGGYIATRSHPTGSKGDQEFYEISLPTDAKWSDSVGLDRPAPVLLGDDLSRQVGALFVRDTKGTIQFSRSADGEKVRSTFLRGELSPHLAYIKMKGERRHAAVSLMPVTRKSEEKDMSDIQETQPLPNFDLGETREFNLGNLIRAEISGDYNHAGYEREVCQEAARNYVGTPKGIVVPTEHVYQRATMVSTGDISGAIGTELRPERYIDINRQTSSVMAAGATIINGLAQNIDIPKLNSDTSATFYAENSAISDDDLDIDTVQLRPKLCAGTASFTRQVLIQATPQIDQLIRRNLELQIMNRIDSSALTGSGVAPNPTGIANQSGIETFTTAGNSTITHSESLDIVAEVASNNISTQGGYWIVNPTDAATIGATSKDSGSGTFVYENGRIAGFPVIESNHATAGTAFFGVFEHCYIGFFGGLDIVVDPYSSSRNAVVHITATQLVDVAVAHAGAFSKVTLTS